MEEKISFLKTFLKEINEEIQSPTSDENAHARIGNYSLDPEEVTGQVIDWILNYLDNRKCPYELAVSIAKEVTQQIHSYLSEFSQNKTEEEREKLFSSSNVYAEAINKLPEICNTFLEQSNLESSCSSKYTTSVFAIKNKRRKMEDRHVIHHDLNALLDLKDTPQQSYYAVFDGHSGIDAACYASAQLHINIAKHPEFITNTPKAITEGYQITDLNFLNKCNKENIKSGSTAVSALVRENTLYLSWLGDSQAVLVKEGAAVTITSPHKPDREDERQRIENLGGHVTYMGIWRVNGLLAVTRAIGDPDQKRFISSEPEVTVINLDGTEDFLILACDGLWDGMSPDDVIAVLYRYVADGSADESLDAVAAKLVHQSKLQGSEDNITAIVVFLRDVKDIKENSAKFMANSSFSVQSQDFLSMNGNMKVFDMGPNSDIPFAKPTVLELNAASSKKWKNSANVMSSAGIGSGASYNYQYVENVEGSFQSSDTSMVDNSQGVFMSHQKVAASCFAPEATALSELPTPPIDDMLASQQYDNFYSTDLYKELNSSQSPEDLQSVDVTNPIDLTESTQLTNINSPAQPVDELITNVENMSLIDTAVGTDMNPDEKLSPNEAVGIASTVVSTTIETAVKCLSSSENQETSAVQSPIKLNPYAKPFVMKSFFNPEESNFQADFNALQSPPSKENAQIHTVGDNLVDTKVEDTHLITKSVENNQFVTTPGDDNLLSSELSTEGDVNQLLTDSSVKESPSDTDFNQSPMANIAMECPAVGDNQLLGDKVPSEHPIFGDNQPDKESPLIADVHQSVMPNADVKCPVVGDHPALGDKLSSEYPVIGDNQSVIDSKSVENPTTQDLLSFSNNVMDQVCEQNIVCVTESGIQEKVKNQIPEENSTNDQLVQSDISSCLKNDELLDILNMEHGITSDPVTDEEKISYQATGDIKLGNEIQTIGQETISSDSVGFQLENLMVGKDLNIVDECLTDEKKLLQTSTSADIMGCLSSDNVASEVKSNEEQLTDICTPGATSSDISSMPESNQNIDMGNVSAVLTPENTTASISETESKSEVVEKEKCEVPNSSLLLENITKESISLMSIKDELLPAGVEVPSDPSVEDSRVETVAVDLKSLPDGIPEAEGVTEDVDSDSEKDGGWSYMKGGNISGSKTKPDNKTSKTVKSIEVKTTAASKIRKDAPKSNLDPKSKPKTISSDKTKVSSLADKNKNASVSDKTKTASSVDKTKAFTSVDKKSVVEKKADIKSKVLKSSSSVTTTTARITADKTSRVTTTVSTVKKEVTEASKTSMVGKPTRPTTLHRTSALTSKPASGSLVDRSAASSRASTKSNVSGMPTKPKVNALSENKSGVKTTASSTLSKGLPSAQSKPSATAPRSTLSRPTATVPSKTSTMTKSTSLQKTTPSESKPKPPVSTLVKKPLTTTMKKPDVNKEVKDSVNKQISAKKNITSSKVESSTSTVANRRVATMNNKSSVSKTSSSATKLELNKKVVPKVPAFKSAAKNPSSVAEKASKSKDKNTVSVQSKTDQTKNSLNIESDQKIVSEMVQVAEEKFIFENSGKEIISKEGENSSNKQEVIENGSLSESVTPVEDKTPAAACTPDSL